MKRSDFLFKTLNDHVDLPIWDDVKDSLPIHQRQKIWENVYDKVSDTMDSIDEVENRIKIN